MNQACYSLMNGGKLFYSIKDVVDVNRMRNFPLNMGGAPVA